MVITQSVLDNKVIDFRTKFIDIVKLCSAMRISSDPKSSEMEERMIFLQNTIDSMDGYDVSLGHMTDDELRYLVELAGKAQQSFGV